MDEKIFVAFSKNEDNIIFSASGREATEALSDLGYRLSDWPIDPPEDKNRIMVWEGVSLSADDWDFSGSWRKATDEELIALGNESL